MKKLIAILLCLAFLAGCGGGDTPSGEPGGTQSPATEQTASTRPVLPTQPETQQPTTAAPTAPHILPETVGIYLPADDGTRAREQIAGLRVDKKAKTDIDCFEVFASDAERIEGSSFASMWQQAWDGAGADEEAKIGFSLRFWLTDGSMISQTIKKPSDAKPFYDYLEVYLYDDIHQTPGVRYTHLEDDQLDGQTVISSIKLTSGSRIDQVEDIQLTAFIYTGDDCFDINGDYIGEVFSTIFITDKE